MVEKYLLIFLSIQDPNQKSIAGGQEKWMQLIKETSCLLPFDIGTGLSLPSEHDWAKLEGTRYIHLMSEEEQGVSVLVLEDDVTPTEPSSHHCHVCPQIHEKAEGCEAGQLTATEDLCLVFQDVWDNLPAKLLHELCARIMDMMM